MHRFNYNLGLDNDRIAYCYCYRSVIHICDSPLVEGMEPEWDMNLYKCKKEIVGVNYVKTLCRWRGALEDYMAHVKQHHRTSYYTTEKQSVRFEWKLPYVGDQSDKCILSFGEAQFLYEIYYSAKKSSVRHQFLLIDDGNLGLEYQVNIMDEVGKREYECNAVESKIGLVKTITYYISERNVRWNVSVEPFYVD